MLPLVSCHLFQLRLLEMTHCTLRLLIPTTIPIHYKIRGSKCCSMWQELRMVCQTRRSGQCSQPDGRSSLDLNIRKTPCYLCLVYRRWSNRAVFLDSAHFDQFLDGIRLNGYNFYGAARLGAAGRGMAGQGQARHGEARRGKHTASLLGVQKFGRAWPVWAWQGAARLGLAWPGMAGQGRARHGAANTLHPFWGCRSLARRGVAGPGSAGRGGARRGKARRG